MEDWSSNNMLVETNAQSQIWHFFPTPNKQVLGHTSWLQLALNFFFFLMVFIKLAWSKNFLQNYLLSEVNTVITNAKE